MEDRKIERWQKKERHRTATTAYPCFLPDLGDSAGAGRAAWVQMYAKIMFLQKSYQNYCEYPANGLIFRTKFCGKVFVLNMVH